MVSQLRINRSGMVASPPMKGERVSQKKARARTDAAKQCPLTTEFFAVRAGFICGPGAGPTLG